MKFQKTKKEDMKLMVNRGLDFILNDQKIIHPFWANNLAQACLGRGRITDGDRKFVVNALIPKIKKKLQVSKGLTLIYDRTTKKWRTDEKGVSEILRKFKMAGGIILGQKMNEDLQFMENHKSRYGKREKELIPSIKNLQINTSKQLSFVELLEERLTIKQQKIVDKHSN